MDHPDPKIRVVDVEVVGDAPHDDEVHPLLLQLPGQGARGSSETGTKNSMINMVIQRSSQLLMICMFRIIIFIIVRPEWQRFP